MDDIPQDDDLTPVATLPSHHSYIDYNEDLLPSDLRAGIDVLEAEVRRIGIRPYMGRDGQIKGDWSWSDSFHSDLWHDFIKEFNLSTQGISDVRTKGFERFNEVLDATNQLKSMITLVDLLKSAAQDILAPAELELERARHRLGRFILDLPLELLAETIRFACDDIYDMMDLSHVNRRFRGVALSMPDMWTHISSGMPTEILRLCIERSKSVPLQIVFDERDNDYELDDNPSNADSPDPGSHMMNCISEFARCCSRWHTIKFDMPKSDYGVPLLGALTLYRLIAVFFRDIHLPRLASFSLFHHGYIPYPSDEPGSRAKFIDTIHFYRSWTAPSLRAISFSGIVPVPIPGASIQELSLNLQVEFNGVFPDFFVMFRDLLTFLHETPSLQTLKICSSSGETSDSDQIRDFPTVTLENLQDLSFMIDYGSTHAHGECAFSSFTGSLRLPNLSTLAVKLSSTPDFFSNGTQDRDFTNIVSSFIPEIGTSASLQNLSLFVYESSLSTPKSLMRMSVALDNYPSLRMLTVGITEGRLIAPAGSTLHPETKNSGSLEQINLRACQLGAEDFLAWVVGELRDGDGLQYLKVSVKKCESAVKEKLLEFIPSAKLEFEGAESLRFGIEDRTLEGLGFYCGRTFKDFD